MSSIVNILPALAFLLILLSISAYIQRTSKENRQKDFGNARYVRNLFESVIENQAVRLSSNKETDKDSLAIITKADIHE